MQRTLDILFSATALAILAPLLVLVALLLRVTGEGEVFFRQNRVGRNGRMIGLWKFATMLKNSPSIGTGTVTLKDDPRVLPIGRVLRRTKINELPQLLNILTGEMSLIGPRPQTKRCFDAFPPFAGGDRHRATGAFRARVHRLPRRGRDDACKQGSRPILRPDHHAL